MGLLLGALSGLGQGLVQNADVHEAQQNKIDLANLDQQNRVDLANLEAELTNRKTTFGLQATTAEEAARRATMVGTVNAARSGLLGQATLQNAQEDLQSNVHPDDLAATTGSTSGFNGSYADAAAKVAALPDGPDKNAAWTQLQAQQFVNKDAAGGTQSVSDLTPMQQAQYAPTQEQKNQATMDALSQTGYLGPEHQAAAITSDVRMQTQAAIAANKWDTLREMRAGTDQMRRDVAADSQLSKVLAGQQGDARKSVVAMALAEHNKTLDGLTKQMDTLITQLGATMEPKLRPGFVSQINQLRQQANRVIEDKAAMLASVGIKPSSAAFPTFSDEMTAPGLSGRRVK